MMISEPIARALAKVVDLERPGTSGLGPSRSSHPLAGPAKSDRKPGLEVIAKVRVRAVLSTPSGRLKAQTRSDPA